MTNENTTKNVIDFKGAKEIAEAASNNPTIRKARLKEWLRLVKGEQPVVKKD